MRCAVVLAALVGASLGSFQIDCEFGRPCRDICPAGQVVADFSVGAKPWHADMKGTPSGPSAFRFRITCKAAAPAKAPPTPHLASILPSMGAASLRSPSSHLLYRDISFADARALAATFQRPGPAAKAGGCPDKARLDLIFLLDASVSISRKNFEEEKQFVKNFLTAYRIGDEWTRVGLIAFAGQPRVEFSFTNVSQTLPSVLKAVSRARFVGGATDLSAALRAAQTMIASDPLPRFRASKAVVLLTDGGHNARRSLPPYVPARRLRKAGVDLFAVSLRGKAPLSQLRSVVQHKRRLFTLPSFAHAPRAAHTLSGQVCHSIFRFH